MVSFRRQTLKSVLQVALLLGLISSGCLVSEVSAADPKISVSINPTRVQEGAAILMEVSVEGISGNAKPTIPPSDGFSYYETGSSSNFSWVNGKMTSSKVFSYQLVSRKPGKYIIGPVSISDSGRTVRAAPIEIEVLPASSSSSGSPAGAQRVGSNRQTPANVPAENRERGLFARIEVDNNNPYQDEQITLRFKLYQRQDVQLSEIGEYEPPVAEGFWREDLGSQSDYRVRIDGELYHVREVAYALFPIRSGEIEIGSASVICMVPARRSRNRGTFNFSLFNREQIPLRSNSIKIIVKPLPEAGRTQAFTGSVGQYTIRAGFDQVEATQGDPLTLNVTVQGTGHVQTIGTPAWPEWTDMRVFDSGEVSSDSRREDKVVGNKTFSKVLIPNRTGTISVAPLEYQFFNPVSGRYETVLSPALAIEVKPPKATFGSGIGGSNEVLALGEDILYIRSDIISRLGPVNSNSFSPVWLIHLIPFGLLGGGFWLRRRRQAMERNPVLARRSRALRLAKKALTDIDTRAAPATLAGEITLALESYLSAWLDQEVRGMRRARLEDALTANSLAETTVTEVMNCLVWADEVRFGAGDGRDIARKPEETLEMISRLEENFRRTDLGTWL